MNFLYFFYLEIFAFFGDIATRRRKSMSSSTSMMTMMMTMISMMMKLRIMGMKEMRMLPEKGK